jgi:hypothetical protein
MSETLNEERVFCPKCRFRFPIAVPLTKGWQVEAQCPSCEWSTFFSVADTEELPQIDHAEWEAKLQRIGKLLWQPINEHRGHPALVWMDRVGNGMFEDDYSEKCFPAPHTVYRFTCGESASYIWQQEESWFVRGWHPLKGDTMPPEPVQVFSFGAALDYLSA